MSDEVGTPPLQTRANEWRSRPALARLARLGMLGVPFLAVVAGAWKLNSLLGPAGSVIEALARWSALSVVSTIVLVGIDRVARQMVPLTALLQLSIVFPDQAPSRMKLALRQGTARHLAQEVAALENASAQDAAEYLLRIVGKLTAHDRLTRGHTERVRAYADLVAVEMGLTADERMKLHWAGLIHDVGKLTVPADVLNKQTKLSDREWSRLKTHPNEGWKLIRPMRGWLGEWARATRDHHERWDGSGYPRGLKGAEISRAGRIISVVDAYDVMTSVRAYKPAYTHEDAQAELARCAGTQFDPEVVRAFLNVVMAPNQRGKVGTWLANSPMAMQATSVAQIPAAATSTIAAALAAITVVAPAMNQPDPELAAERVVQEVVVEMTATTAPPSTTRAPATTTTSTSTTTTTTTTLAPTVPPTTTAAPATTTMAAPTTTTTLAEVFEVPTTTTTTTTTLPPSAFAGGYLGPGSGGSLYGLVPGTSGTGATNWDSAANADPGHTLTSGPTGLIEIDADNVTAWAITLADETQLEGTATLRLYVAAPDFDESLSGALQAGLVDCTNQSTNCTTIATGSALFSQSTFGADFGVVTVNLGAVDHTLEAGHTLLVSMTVPQSMPNDTWIAFGTDDYPSRFRLT